MRIDLEIVMFFGGLALYLWFFAIAIIGLYQVFDSLGKAILIEDWKSSFGQKLIKYFIAQLMFWIFLLMTIRSETLRSLNLEWVFFLFIPGLSTALATYYWRITNNQ